MLFHIYVCYTFISVSPEIFVLDKTNCDKLLLFFILIF